LRGVKGGKKREEMLNRGQSQSDALGTVSFQDGVGKRFLGGKRLRDEFYSKKGGVRTKKPQGGREG